MSFNTEISKTETNTLVELYEFTLADGTQHRFTNNLTSITFQSNLYSPGALKRSAFTREQTLKEVTVNISSKITAATSIYLTETPPILVTVRIWQAFAESPGDFRLIFVGVIRSVTVKNLIATAICVSLNKIRRTKLPLFVYQSTCNHQLFDGNCGLNEDSYKTTATGVIITASGRKITHSAFINADPIYFEQGTLEFLGERRLVVNQTSDELTIQQPFDARAVSGVTMIARPGCDKLFGTCGSKFNNTNNFVGFPYIPTSNIVLWGI